MSNISFDPFKTQGSPTGMFNVESRGMVQGDAWDDPAVRLQLCSGTMDSTTPVWAGLGVMECIASTAANVTGSNIKPASATVCNAFTVSNQAYHGLITAGNNVPQYMGGGSVHYYRIGSGARIPLPISAAVAALADGSKPVSSGFIWDVTNNVIDVDPGDSTTNPKIAVKLIQVSQQGNLTVKKNPDGTVVWDTTQPCGLFLI